MREKCREPLAIVGIGCRLPGGVYDAESFWEFLRSGQSGISEVPEDRWNLQRYYDPNPDVPGKMITRWGGFLESVGQFDARFFGISPREALRMDPQQRWLLEIAWETLEDGGLAPDRISGSRTGVFVGISSNDYANIQMKGPADVDVHTNSGSTLSIASNRISYLFNLKGPSVSVDTACSSALVAVNLACQSIWYGQCELALAGGVNAIITPDSSIGFSKASMLSPNGQCFAFDARANGYVRGEGVGMIAIKPLAKALSDRDPMYAVIRAAVVNQDGRTNAMTVPGLESQSEMLEEAYEQAGIAPGRVCYMEAHGTGTPVGDPIEVQALGRVLSRERPEGKDCVIGSVKTNIGHLESGSGIAGLIKAALVLKHGEIPPNLNFETPNPNIPFEELRLRVPVEAEGLTAIGESAVVAVNSFGFGGTNAHIVLEEVPNGDNGTQRRKENGKAEPTVIPISAKTDAALKSYTKAFREYIEKSNGMADLRDLAYSASMNKNQHEQRIAVVGDEVDDILEKLKRWELEDRKLPGVVVDRIGTEIPEIAFIFSGQGSQWWGMGQELIETEPVFKKTIERVDNLIQSLGGWSLLQEMRKCEQDSQIDRTVFAQPAIFALEIGLAEMWRSRGVEPTLVIGHSVGEVAAAYWAGAYTLEDAVKVIFHRSRLQETTGGAGRMVAVGISQERAIEAIRGYENQVAVAAVNSPNLVTLAGDTEVIETVVEALEKEEVFIRWLPIDYAFHTHQMEPIRDELLESLADLQPRSGNIPFISTVTGDSLEGSNLNAAYWWTNVRDPVKFEQGVAKIIDRGVSFFLELGPHPIHTTSVKECLSKSGVSGRTLVSLRRNEPEKALMLEAFGSLYTVGYPVNWAALHGSRAEFVRLPSYPWQHETFWLESRESRDYRFAAPSHPLLGLRVNSPKPTWENQLDSRLFGYLADHRFWDSMIFPAAGYAELGIAVARELFPEEPYVVEDLQTTKALFFSETKVPKMRVVYDESDKSIEIFSSTGTGRDWDMNARCRIQKLSPREGEPGNFEEVLARMEKHISHEEYYSDYEAAGYQFGPNFQQLTDIWRKDGESLGRIEVTDEVRRTIPDYHFQPAVLDACFHCVKGAQVFPDDSDAEDNFFLPSAVRRVRLYHPVEVRMWGHVTVNLDDGNIVDADIAVYNDEGKRIADISGFRVERVDQNESKTADDLLNCFYQFEWKQQHLRGSGVSGSAELSGTQEIVKDVLSEATSIYERYELQTYYEWFMPAINKLCVSYAINAFLELGWNPVVGERMELEGFAGRLQILEQHVRLTRALLGYLREEGYLNSVSDDVWEVTRIPNRQADPLPGLEELGGKFPRFGSELPLIITCGPRLAEILVGKLDGMELVFPGGSAELFGKFYREGADFLAYNEMIQRAVSFAIRNLPEKRTIRVLEVGAGTGSLTGNVLPVLPSDRAEFTFTDNTPIFLNEARKLFSDFEFVEYEILDIEKDPAEQGVDLHSFDLILATNVLHATCDLKHTLAIIRQLLASKGLFIFLDVTTPRISLDLVFGQLKGWWQFTDTELRKHSALLSREQWEVLLRQCEFENVVSFVNTPDGTPAMQTTFVVEGPEIDAIESVGSEGKGPKQAYLIVGDDAGLGEQLFRRLEEEASARCILATPGEEFGPIGERRYRFRPDHGDDMVELLKKTSENDAVLTGVVHLLSADHPLTEETSPEALMDSQRSGVLSILHLGQALAEVETDPVPRVWAVTRGAHAVNTDDPIARIASTPIFGMLRVANNEHPENRWTAIDLESEATSDQAISLFEEIVLDDDELEVGIRSGRRFCNRLTRVTLDEVPFRTKNAVGKDGILPYRLEIPTPGVLKNLSLSETTRRPPGKNEIEIQIEAGGINFRDVMKALGIYPGNSRDLKWLGDDFSGVVVRVGDEVTDLREGDAVVGMAPNSFRSYVTVSRDLVFSKPPHFSFEEAATLPTVYLTAHYALNHLARMRKGESVLIHAGAGGVGQAAIRIAQNIGLEIFSTAGSPEKREYLKKMGAHHVMDSRSMDFADEIMEISGGRGVDAVLNALARDAIPKNLSVLAPFGRYLEIGKVDIYQNSKIGLEPFKNNISFFAIDLAQHLEERPGFFASLMQELSSEFHAGRLAPLPFKRFPITDAVEAFHYFARAQHIGKNVLSFNEEEIPIGPSTEAEELFEHDATYLITGGSSGFGLEVAKWMVRYGARTLVLLSRSGPKTDSEKNDVETLRKEGVNVVDARADISVEDDVIRVIGQIRSELPPLKGVIHGAMVLHDAFIRELDRKDFEKVLRPKMIGAWLLHQNTRDCPLDHFISFSSVSSMVGAGRQSNYCSGNLFLDALAHHRRSLGLPALTVNWGALLEAGFVSRDEKTAQYLDKIGMKSFTIGEALEIFALILRRDPVQLGAARIDWKALAKINPAILRSRTLSLIAEEQAAEEAAGGQNMIRPRILEAAPEDRLKMMEEFICEQVAQVFGTSSAKIDRETPLTQVGLDSLMAIELMNRLESSLGTSLSMSDFLQGPNIEQLAAPLLEKLILTNEGKGDSVETSPSTVAVIEKTDRSEREFPLSYGQRALWFLNRLAPSSSAYNLVFSSKISPSVDIPVMEKAFAALFRRHPMLDATFSSDSGQLVQILHEGRTIDFREHDSTHLSEDQIKELIIEHANKPFDLERGPVIRLELFRTRDDAHVALLCMHHIVSDAWSVVLLMNDLIESYFSIGAGAEPQFNELEYRYSDYVQWQSRLLESSESGRTLKYWTEELRDAPMVLDLPTDHARPPVQTFNGSTHGFKLSRDLTRKVEALAADNQVTLYITLLSAFQILLHRYSNQEDLVIGSPFAGRHHQEFHDLVGFFINPVALRSRVDDDPVFADYLQRVNNTFIGAFENQEFPIQKLVEHLEVKRDSSRSPIFQVTFSMEKVPGVDEQGIAVFLIGQGGHEFEVGDLSVKSIDLNLRQAQFEITLVVEEAGGNIYGCWQYNRDLFEPETISLLNELYEQILEDLVVNPKKRISEVSFLTQEKERKILEEWNATAADCPDDTCLHQLVAEHALRTPNSTAVTCDGVSLTYAQLDRRANAIAGRLQEEGVGIDVAVGIFLDRSIEMLIGMLGVLKSGGCFVPLDPTYPTYRLEQMLKDAKPAAVLTHPLLEGNLPKGEWKNVHLKDIGEANYSPNVEGQTSESLAYIIYTSGSTGQPKGVEIPHRAVVNFLISMRDTPGLSADDTLVAVTTLSFDISTLELFLPLISNAQVVIATREETKDGRRLSMLMDEYAATTMQATPATWQMLLDSGWEGKYDLRVFCGGEALPRELAEALLPCTRAVWNLYGPTETTVWSTVDKVTSGVGNVPIGRPIANTTVYILDDNHNALPPGFTGNLYIGGDGLARGYHEQMELTSERFVEITLPNGKEERLYDTGDLARFLSDGKIEYMGRNDSQVKVRGYRIELEEVEHQIVSHPSVKGAVVMKRDDLPGESLAAYIIPEDSSEGIVVSLRRYLSNRLPEYMRPGVFVTLEDFPLTPNNKIDRKKLPAPTLDRTDLQVEYVEPQTPSEKILVDILNEAFLSDRIGIRDNFFELGGDSLLAVQILTEISKTFNRPMPVENFLQNPTIESLAQYLDTVPSLPESKEGSIDPNRALPNGFESGDLDSSYLTIDILDVAGKADDSLPTVDSVALAYIPDTFLKLTGLTRDVIVHNWLHGKPFVSNLYETSFGRIALIMLPRLGAELYKDQEVLSRHILEAMELAARMGAKNVSLTGLIPSATDYGRMVEEWANGHDHLPSITTGHATTTATIIKSIDGLLAETNRDFSSECVCILGLGSIGYATLRLMLEVLPHPSGLVLCDLFKKQEALEEIRRELEGELGFKGEIRIETTKGRLPDAVYDATFILGATNVPGILDVERLQPGSLIVDDSFPPCFRVFDAIKRLETHHDFLFTTGGLLRLEEEIKETIFLPSGTASLLEELGGNQLLELAGRDSREITGCILSSLLTGRSPEIKPTLGPVSLQDSLAHFNLLQSPEFGAARPQCENYFISPETIARFNAEETSETAAAGPIQAHGSS